jgi:patatin-like phospholipase/acyl hydrolase
MARINEAARARGYRGPTLRPSDVFKLVAGTSTGGLIAIMLGKLGMTVEQCMKYYHNFSQSIFRKKSTRGRLSMGLWRSRYSEGCLQDCVQKLLQDHGFSGDHQMQAQDQGDTIDW